MSLRLESPMTPACTVLLGPNILYTSNSTGQRILFFASAVGVVLLISMGFAGGNLASQVHGSVHFATRALFWQLVLYTRCECGRFYRCSELQVRLAGHV